uniref:glycosyltransferase family 4 protein n=1 Tax=Segatella hominis TaxID=2518605 RepID=UPI00402A55FA
MSKSVLLANQSTGYLMVDIVNAYVRSGKYDSVELFAGEINIRPSVPDSSVHVIKTVKYDKSSTLKRLLTWVAAFVHMLWVVWRRSKHCHLVLVSNPPLNVFVPLFTRKKFSFIVYDLYPDSLFSQGFVKRNSFLGRWWMTKNKQIFAKADCVFTLSEDMKKAVAQYVAEDKIKIVYNWAHNEHMRPIDKKENVFLADLKLQDKFIVLYSGNMGMTHDVDMLVDVADRLKENKTIHFLFIGEGAKKPIVEAKVARYGLENCSVLPYQPLEVLPYSMGAADLAVVTTDAKQSGLSVPSKTYTYLATGAALLCLAEENTELARLTRERKIGRCFVSQDLGGIARYILQMVSDRRLLQEYKENSRKTSLMYTPENAQQYVL